LKNFHSYIDVGTKGEERNAYKTLHGICEWKRTLRRLGHMCENNIKMDLEGLKILGDL